MTGSIVFLIPAYQPTDALCKLLQEIRLHDPSHIVVVDDGSGAPGSTLLGLPRLLIVLF